MSAPIKWSTARLPTSTSSPNLSNDHRMDSPPRRFTWEELLAMSAKQLKEALGKEGLPNSNATKSLLIKRYLEGKRKPMSGAERTRKSRANQSTKKKEEVNAKRRKKRAERPDEQRRRETEINTKQKAAARCNPEYKRRENSREKRRKRLWRGPPDKSKHYLPYRALWGHDFYDEANAIVEKYHLAREAGGRRFEQELRTSDYDTFAIVEGSGTPEINGRYRWVCWGKYEMSAIYNGKKVVFTLFARRRTFVHQVPCHQDVSTKFKWVFMWWYIAILPASLSCHVP